MLKIPVSPQDHQTGSKNAKIVLVEYGDYQCPHCGRAHPLIKRLLKQFRDEVLFVFRNFPLQESHPAALSAALSAEAAALQGKFWEMHDLIFERQDGLMTGDMNPYAQAVGLDMKKFAHDSRSKELIAKVEQDFEGGVRSGVNGTPTFFINGNRLNTYDETYASLSNAIQSLV